MKKLLLLLALILLIACLARADGLYSFTFFAAVPGTTQNLINTGIAYHKLTWNVSGTVTTCQVAVDTSVDGVTWVTGGAIANQLCTSNGASTVVNVVANYIRIDMTSFVGTGSVTATWNGYTNNPGGGSGTIGGSIAANQVAFGSAANTITGSANLTYTDGAALNITSSAIGNTNLILNQFSTTQTAPLLSIPTESNSRLDLIRNHAVGSNFTLVTNTGEPVFQPSYIKFWDTSITTGDTGGIHMSPLDNPFIRSVATTGFSSITFFSSGSTGHAAIEWSNTITNTPNAIALPLSTGAAGMLLSTDGGNPQQASWITTAFTSLTATCAGAQTWAIGSQLLANASITLTGACTLNLTGPINGGNYVLEVIQGAGGSHTLALGTGCTWKVSGGGAGAITPTTTAAAIDVLAFTYDGTNCYANFNKNFN